MSSATHHSTPTTAHSLVTGVVPPLITPRDERGNVDAASVASLVTHLLDGGVTGLFVCGSSGETALLSNAQRRDMVRHTVAAAAGRVPVYAGAIATGTGGVIEQALAAQAEGAAAIVATPPFYVVPNAAEVVAHYRAVRAAVHVPVIAYDIPSATHSPLPLEALAELAADGTIAGLKDSSGDITKFRQALALGGEEISTFTGSETFSDLAVQLGASGIVPGLGNVDPAGYVAIERLVRAGDLAGAAAQQDRLLRLFGIVQVANTGRIGATAAALGSFKAALYLQGVIANPATFAPLGRLTAAEFQTIAGMLRDAGLQVLPERMAAVLEGAPRLGSTDQGSTHQGAPGRESVTSSR